MRDERAAFAAMYGPDLLYLTRDPWPWGQPHEAAGIHRHCWWRGGGLAARCARWPNGNVTGFSNPDFTLVGKWLQILKDIVPSVTRIGLMVSTTNAASAYYYRSFDALAPSLAMTPVAIPIRGITEVEHALELLAHEPNSGLVIPNDAVLEAPPVRELIIRSTASRRLPVVFARRSFVVEGGLVSYGIEPADLFRRAASYVDRILKGERPSDLPVQQPTKFEFAINLRTARAFGLNVPMALVASADEVIE